ncbi:S-adenosyl-L-methionine-dependent methyltransferase, partial [Ascobolus immersus RN42]
MTLADALRLPSSYEGISKVDIKQQESVIVLAYPKKITSLYTIASRKPNIIMPENNPGVVNEEIRAKLLNHFKEKQHEEQAQGWIDLWKNDFKPWDKGFPCPELEDAFEKGKIEEGDNGKKTALVPGCGHGYDLVTLANAGYTAVGLDIAPQAPEKFEEYLAQNPLKSSTAKVVVGDFYGNFPESEKQFDLVFDYTFFCAMPPSRRPDWAQRMSELVKKGGNLICLEFPLGKPAETQGPPWGVTEEAYAEILSAVGFKRLERYEPEKVHEIGKGKTMLSKWVRD